MIRRSLLLGLLVVLSMPAVVRAHEVRPGYLQIRQSSAETYDVLWKVPAKGDLRLGIHVRFPDHCAPSGEVLHFQTRDAFHERSVLTCAGGLDGGVVQVEGLVATLTDVLVRVERSDGSTQVVRLTASSPSFAVEASPSRFQVASTYLRLGVEHILFGVDHLLFVLALFLLVGRTRRLVTTVTAFTAAHSLTLAGASLGFLNVSQGPVEAVIALSIVFVAAEIVHSRQGHRGLAERTPWVVAFVFGLLHGFGFAGALSEAGLPPQAIPLALFFFNVGVEVGQLGFIACAIAVVAAGRRIGAPWPSWAWRMPAYGIGGVSAYWFIDRIAGLGS